MASLEEWATGELNCSNWGELGEWAVKTLTSCVAPSAALMSKLAQANVFLNETKLEF